MTNHNQGAGGAEPSLFQARRTRHDHAHNHPAIINHRNHHNQHRHLHQEFSQSLEDPEVQQLQPQENHHHARSPSNAKLHARQVVVIQTVSVVQYVDATGALVSLSTLRSDPVPPSPIDNVPAAVTAGITTPDDLLPSVSLPDPTLDPSQDGTPTPTHPAVTEPEFSSSFRSTSAETLTSTPSGITPPFPILSSGNFNSSSTRLPPTLFTNSTLGLFQNSTRTSTSFFRSTTSSSFIKSSTSSPTRLTSTTSTAPAVVINGSGGDAGVAGIPAPEPTPEDTGSGSGPGLTPEARNAVVGGVVGSVAGIAIVALVLMFFVKWRKQRGQGIMLLGDGDSTIRGRGLGSGPSSGPSGGASRMSQLRFPFAVPSALTKLNGNRAIEAAPAKPEEKGFYRVSGRKLISVLESGGDGYSDPDPHTSVGTSYYRDSQAFLDSSHLPPLQLGSPMRPASGVIVYHDGPARTPIEEHGPFPPGQRRSAFPNLLQVQDPVGRSINIQHAGSRVSQSRFTEDS